MRTQVAIVGAGPGVGLPFGAPLHKSVSTPSSSSNAAPATCWVASAQVLEQVTIICCTSKENSRPRRRLAARRF